MILSTTLPENTLVEQLCQGDEAAFNRCIHTYQDMVYNTSLHFLALREDAEEITQDVFVEMHKSIGQFKGNSSLKTWLYRITISKCLEHIRKIKRKKRFGFMVSVGALVGHQEEPRSIDHPGISEENKERMTMLYHQIDKLAENQRIAFTLHHLEGLSYKEIAETMQVSLSSVESLIFRARQNLKKRLSAYYKNRL